MLWHIRSSQSQEKLSGSRALTGEALIAICVLSEHGFLHSTGVTTVLTMTTLMMGARTSLPNANCFIKAIDVYLGICFSFIFGALLEYAVAHFCTLHRLSSKELPKVF